MTAAALAARSRADQGLPPTIRDRRALERIARVVAGSGNAARRRRPGDLTSAPQHEEFGRVS